MRALHCSALNSIHIHTARASETHIHAYTPTLSHSQIVRISNLNRKKERKKRKKCTEYTQHRFRNERNFFFFVCAFRHLHLCTKWRCLHQRLNSIGNCVPDNWMEFKWFSWHFESKYWVLSIYLNQARTLTCLHPTHSYLRYGNEAYDVCLGSGLHRAGWSEFGLLYVCVC